MENTKRTKHFRARNSLGDVNIPTANTFKSIEDRRYTFNVYLSNGVKKRDLVRSFLRTVKIPMLASSEGFAIELADGSTWPVIFERYAGHAVTRGNFTYILSFQRFADGEYFAIARLFQEKPKSDMLATNKGRF